MCLELSVFKQKLCISVCCTRVWKVKNNEKVFICWVYKFMHAIFCSLIFCYLFLSLILKRTRAFLISIPVFRLHIVWFYILFVSQPAFTKQDTQCVCVCGAVIWLPKINMEYLNLKIPAVKLSYRHMSSHSNNLKYFKICVNFRKIYSCHDWKMRRKTRQNSKLEKLIQFIPKINQIESTALLSRHHLNSIV